MNMFVMTAALLVLGGTVTADELYSHELDDVRDELDLVTKIEAWEKPLIERVHSASDNGYVLRSAHFIFGMPRLVDRRHDLDGATGVSLLVREGFVIAHFDRMRSPLWVCQRWTKDEQTEDKPFVPSLNRNWKEDPELPAAARIGTNYGGTVLDRGHMAKHSMNRAWGRDSSIKGCLMSNSAPQHEDINQSGGAWNKLEARVERVVETEGMEVVWTINGAAFRDKENPADETPEQDFAGVVRIATGFGVPDATFKIVAWFDEEGDFHARGYVFEQPHEENGDGLSFEIPDQSQDLETFIVPIDEIEKRTGLDFFPDLKDGLEHELEAKRFTTMWDDE